MSSVARDRLPTSLLDLDPDSYRPHTLHSPERTYSETNCYTDILIELLHARGQEPLAAMGATVRLDFEGDQWTFFKPPPEDLELLFGIDIHEMQPYRALPDQTAEQIECGHTLIVELDAWYLPDSAAISYRREHVKSSVVMEGIDRDAQRLRYFHGGGLYELEGEDYRGVFRLGRPFSDDVLPPYTELVRFDVCSHPDGPELRELARERLRHHLARRPADNPFERFRERLEDDLPRLLEGQQADYHAYAFATVRMAGSSFEAAAAHVDWLLDEHEPICAAFARIVAGCKALSFRLARRRAFEPAQAVAELAHAWDEAMTRLDDAVG